MGSVVLGIVALVVVGGPFGSASAEVTDSSPSLIEVEVQVEGPEGTSVVVHAVDPGSDQQTVALVERSAGRYIGRFETRPADLQLFFEDVSSGEQADPVSLTELGVDPVLLGARPATTAAAVEDDGEAESGQWGWLALAFGFGSLALVATWVLMGGDDPGGDDPGGDDPGGDDPGGDDEPSTE